MRGWITRDSRDLLLGAPSVGGVATGSRSLSRSRPTSLAPTPEAPGGKGERAPRLHVGDAHARPRDRRIPLVILAVAKARAPGVARQEGPWGITKGPRVCSARFATGKHTRGLVRGPGAAGEGRSRATSSCTRGLRPTPCAAVPRPTVHCSRRRAPLSPRRSHRTASSSPLRSAYPRGHALHPSTRINIPHHVPSPRKEGRKLFFRSPEGGS